MPEDIDYQALVEKLQKELEAARLTIVKMRHNRNLLEKLDDLKAHFKGESV